VDSATNYCRLLLSESEITETKNLLLSSNVSAGYFKIATNRQGGVLKVFSVSGKLMYCEPLNSSNVFLELPDGIYFMSLFSDDKLIRTEKIVIAK
jgi:hypothetical protein